MKTNKHILIQVAAAAAAAAAVTLVACTDDMGLGFSNPAVHNPTEEICFTTSGTVGQSAEPFTRHAGYVEETDEEWEVFGTDTADVKAGTRRDAEESLYDYFSNAGVRIFLYDGEWGPSNTTYIQVPTAAELATVPALPGTFNADGLLSPVTPILWSESKDYHYAMDGQRQFFEHFRAYAFSPLNGDEKNGNRGIDNLSAAGKSEYDHGSMGNPPSITYEVPNAPQDQVDLIAAYSGEVDGDYCKAVPLTFKHAFAAVQFKLGFEATTRVKSLTISGVYNRGKGSFDPTTGDLVVTPVTGAIGSGSHPEITPSNPATSADLYSYTYAYHDTDDYKEYVYSGGSLTNDGVLTDGGNTLMMIPQTLPEGATLILEYYAYEGGNWVAKTFTCDISGFQWKSGHRYIYTIKEEPSYDIFFDLAAGNVRILTNGTYDGYVFVDGVATKLAGTHNPSNKYYVYQSTGTTTGSNDKDHTGYTTVTWNYGSPTAKPTIPIYPEVTINGKSWSEFITNNKNSADVMQAWEPAATAAGRVVTSYNINDVNHTQVNMTIDNIWTSADPGIYGRGGTATQLTFALKGDNRIKRFIANTSTMVHAESYDYNFTEDDPFVKITSYYGDESAKGTLTVMQDNPEGVQGNAYTYFQCTGGGEGSNNYGRIIFAGGNTYVATSILTHNSGSNGATAIGCISAAANANGLIQVTGGVLTAVAHSTGAAIGGGCGYNHRGGDGMFIMTGGKVYAYQLGTYSRTMSYLDFPLRSTAIGGGSTYRGPANAGYIKITGGEVYAESVGGVAIGGGTSGSIIGGKSEIYIGGNAKVTAKSVEGDIYAYGRSGNPTFHIRKGSSNPALEIGTSVGGGNAGNEYYTLTAGSSHDQYITGSGANRQIKDEYKANGGAAKIVITGSPTVRAGSIGGGTTGTTGRLIGAADIKIYGGDVQGQAVMADTHDPSLPPSFLMSGGTLAIKDNSILYTKDDGGAVWMDKGTCTITSGTISDYKAQNGGAVYMEGGTFTMTGGIIQNCRANYNSSSSSGGKGGAVYIADASGSATLNLSGSAQIKNSFADWNGGGIYLEGGNVNVTGGGVSVNKALGVSAISATEKGNGAGIYLMKGNYTQSGGTIAGNTATRDGGGIYVSSETTDLNVNITGGSITSNVSEHFGAGLFVKPGGGRSATVNIGTTGAPFSKLSPEITGNSASLRGGGIYAEGTNAMLNLYDGKIKNNCVSAYVYNQDITNEGGSVLLELDNEGLPAPDLNYITVAFDPNGGNFTDGNSAGTPAYRFLVTSTNSTLDIPTPKRKNFKFIGWLPSIGESVTHVSTWTSGMIFNFYKDITLTAQWELAM